MTRTICMTIVFIVTLAGLICAGIHHLEGTQFFLGLMLLGWGLVIAVGEYELNNRRW